MPILEFYENSLHPISEYYLTQSHTVKKYYDDNWFKGVDENELVDEAVCANMHVEEVQTMLFNSVWFVNRLFKKKKVIQAINNCDKRTFFLVTFTSDPSKDEYQNMIDITRFRQAHFKNYKHVYVEEKMSASSQKYHQHILIECPPRVVHTQQGLKRANYYKAVINSKVVTPTKSSIDYIIKEYFSKENKPKGDLDYFLNLQF